MVCDWELGEARRKDALDRAQVRGEEPPAELLAEERGLHSSIEVDVRDYLQKKTYKELENIHSGVESQLQSGTAKVVEFWEVILKRIHIYKAKVWTITFISHFFGFCFCFVLQRLFSANFQAFLKEYHTKMLRMHLQRLEQHPDSEDRYESTAMLSPIPEDEAEHDGMPLSF